jgi:hypothetical protein
MLARKEREGERKIEIEIVFFRTGNRSHKKRVLQTLIGRKIQSEEIRRKSA